MGDGFRCGKDLRPLSRLRRQLPLRRGAKGGGSVIGCDCLPCARGGGSDACGRAGGVVFFSGDLKLYRCVYCGCPTGSCRPNRKKRAGNARPYVIDFCSDYARRGDHWSPVVQVLPEATPQSASPTAPLTQGSHFFTSSVGFADTFPSKGKARAMAFCAAKICDPSVGCADSSPYAGEPRAIAFNAQKILRPLSRLRRQLPLRRGAVGDITAAQNAIS